MSRETARPGALVEKISGGVEIVVYPMTYGKARLVRGLDGSDLLDGGWCYADPREAVVAALCWDGEGDPPGPWHRSVMDGRRREIGPDGQVVREWVAA